LTRGAAARPWLARVLLALFGLLSAAGLSVVPFRSLPPGALWLQAVYAVLAGATVAVLLAENETVADGARLLGTLFFGSFVLLLSAVILGAPFGSLHYTANLGPRLMDLVPIGVPFLWIAVVGGALAASRALRGPPRQGWAEAIRVSLTAATLVTLISFSLDPVARVLRLWRWDVTGRVHGVPFLSFLGWWSSSLVLAVGAFSLAPRLRLLRHGSPPGPIGTLLVLQALVLGVAIRARLPIAVVGGAASLLLLVVALLRSASSRVPVEIRREGSAEAPVGPRPPAELRAAPAEPPVAPETGTEDETP
jgi:putative membrane protein